MKQVTIESEMQRRLDLINDVEFRQQVALLANKLDISFEEWEKNKAYLFMFFANQFCSLENKIYENQS